MSSNRKPLKRDLPAGNGLAETPHPSAPVAGQEQGRPLADPPQCSTRSEEPELAEISTKFIELWTTEETLRLKHEGWSFREIAAWLNERACEGGMQRALGTRFPRGFFVSAEDCSAALSRALERSFTLGSEEMRRLDSQRCERMYKSLAGKALRGDTAAAEAAARILQYKALINSVYGSSGPTHSTLVRRPKGLTSRGHSRKAQTGIAGACRGQRRPRTVCARVDLASPPAPLGRPTRRQTWDQFRADSALLNSHRVSNEELEWLRRTALLGELRSKKDILFVLQQLRAGFIHTPCQQSIHS